MNKASFIFSCIIGSVLGTLAFRISIDAYDNKIKNAQIELWEDAVANGAAIRSVDGGNTTYKWREFHKIQEEENKVELPR